MCIINGISDDILNNVPIYDASLNYFETIINKSSNKLHNMTIANHFNETNKQLSVQFYYYHDCFLQERFYNIANELVQITFYENCKIIAQVFYKTYKIHDSYSFNNKIKSKHYTNAYSYDVYYNSGKPYIVIENCPNSTCACVYYNKGTNCHSKNTLWLLNYSVTEEIICESYNTFGMCFKNGSFYYVY